jgi:hypothetical protein
MKFHRLTDEIKQLKTPKSERKYHYVGLFTKSSGTFRIFLLLYFVCKSMKLHKFFIFGICTNLVTYYLFRLQ